MHSINTPTRIFLRVPYAMGWHQARLIDGYPNLYADLGVELWLHPITKDFAIKFLRSAKEYGFLDRVLFGSDQMVWPDDITQSIQFLSSLGFLTSAEKQDILYNNARTFLGIKE